MGIISVRFAAGAALLAGLFGVPDPSLAQERQNEPGKFDFIHAGAVMVAIVLR
jgi:hypothetical protein